MNTTSFAVRKYNKRKKFREGFRIEATKDHQDACKMFIGGLSRDLSKEALLEYLSQFGEIIDFIIKMDPNTGLSRGFGFVLFKDSSTVEKVLLIKNHELNGKKIEFKRAKALESQYSIRKVFVGSLNPRISEEKIRAYFGTFGQIEAIELPVCSETQERRSFCFITYQNENPVRKVLENKYHLIGSSRCEVKMALPKEYLQRQQNKNKVKERKNVPTARSENGWGGAGTQGFHIQSNSNTQEANQEVERADPLPLRADSTPIMAYNSGFSATPSDTQANPSAFVGNSNVFRASHYALGSNPNTFWESQHPSGTNTNAFTSQYALGSYQNAFGENQYNLGTRTNVLGTTQYALRTNSNAFNASQYVLSINPNNFQSSQNALVANPNYLTCPLMANSNVFGPSHYALWATQNAVEANQNVFRSSRNVCGAADNGEEVFIPVPIPVSTELNISQVCGGFMNVYNNLPVLHAYNGDYFFLYSYGTYDMGHALI